MTSADHPNVIVFFTDQQRWDTLGCLGNPLGLTPNVDLAARYGTLFETAITTNPVCAPARAAMQTGKYPTATGVYRNGLTLSPDAPTLGRLFGAAGYHTGYIGKWHLSADNPVPAEEQGGYHEWLASNILEFTSDAYHTVVWDQAGEPVFLPGYRPDSLVDAAIRFVARASEGDQPFMLFLSLIEPHHQNELDNYPAPEVYRDTYTDGWLPPDLATLPGTARRHIAGYYGQIKRVDEGFGRLRDALTSLGRSEDTVLMYTSDHGSHFKTRNGEYKRSPQDGSVRVPLVITGPGFTGGARVRTPVSTIDIVPTLLTAAGIPVPEGLDGAPLDRIRGDEDADVLIQISESEVGRALRTKRWKYHVVATDVGDVPDASAYQEEGLYDLVADPYELDNIIDSLNHHELIEGLRTRLISRIQQIEGTEVTINPASTPTRDLRYPDTHYERTMQTGRMFE